MGVWVCGSKDRACPLPYSHTPTLLLDTFTLHRSAPGRDQRAAGLGAAEQVAVAGLHGVQVALRDGAGRADEVDRIHEVVLVVAVAVDAQRVAELVRRDAL